MALSAFRLLCNDHQPETVCPVNNRAPHPPPPGHHSALSLNVTTLDASQKWTCPVLSPCDWLISLSMVSSGVICVAAHTGIFFLFKVKNITVLVHILFVYPFTHCWTPGHLYCFCPLAAVSNTAGSTGARISPGVLASSSLCLCPEVGLPGC